MTLTAVAGILYVAVFTAYSYHMKQRMPTLDELKDFTREAYYVGHKKALIYYSIAEKHTSVYYAYFEKHHLPIIQQYSKVTFYTYYLQ